MLLLLLLLLLLRPRPPMWQRLVRELFSTLQIGKYQGIVSKVRGTVSTRTFSAVSACGCYEGSEGERLGVRGAGAKGAGLAAVEAGI
jgi:hypothetical protein